VDYEVLNVEPKQRGVQIRSGRAKAQAQPNSLFPFPPLRVLLPLFSFAFVAVILSGELILVNKMEARF